MLASPFGGFSPPDSVTSATGYLRVTFQSDALTEYIGFKMNFQGNAPGKFAPRTSPARYVSSFELTCVLPSWWTPSINDASHQNPSDNVITKFVLANGTSLPQNVTGDELRVIGMTDGPLNYTQLLINKQPSFEAPNIIWPEGGSSYDKTWATFSRGKWQGLDTADEIDQRVTFVVTAHPADFFEVLPAVRPCQGIACTVANLTFTAKVI